MSFIEIRDTDYKGNLEEGKRFPWIDLQSIAFIGHSTAKVTILNKSQGHWDVVILFLGLGSYNMLPQIQSLYR